MLTIIIFFSVPTFLFQHQHTNVDNALIITTLDSLEKTSWKYFYGLARSKMDSMHLAEISMLHFFLFSTFLYIKFSTDMLKMSV